MKKIDSFIWKIFDEYLDWVIFFFLLFVSVVIRVKYIGLLDFYKGETDYNNFLLPWTKTYAELGIINGLKQGVGNYYIPYNVFLAIISKINVQPYILIGLFSIIFDYLIAFCVYKIANTFSDSIVIKNKRYVKCFAIAFTLIPMVIENSAMWKQCDAIYSAFLMVSLIFILRERYSLAFVFVGIAFSFKLQAIFIIPFFVILYFVKRKFSLLNFLWIPLIYIMAGLPAIVCGRSIIDTLSIYFGQTSESHCMRMNFATVYSLGMEDETVFFELALMVPIVIFVFAFYHLYNKKFSHSMLIYLLAWSELTCVLFLPGMHERYDYFPIIVLTMMAVFFRRKLMVPVIILYVISACTYGNCFYGFEPNYQVLALFYLGVYCYISSDLISCIRKGQLDG